MAVKSSATPRSEVPNPWSEIDILLDEVAQLSRTDRPSHDFHAEVLSRAVRASGAGGGLIWTGGSPKEMQLEARADPTRTAAIDALINSSAHRALIESVAQTRHAQVVLPSTTSAAETGTPNPTDFVLVAAPLAADHDSEACGVIELLQPLDSSIGSPQGCLEFLDAVSELIAEYHRHRRFRDMQDRAIRSNAFEDFSARIHRSLDVRTTAYEIANEGRRFVHCDRLTVVRCEGRGRCTVLAISGLDSIDSRSNAVHHLEELARLSALSGVCYEFGAGTADVAPDVTSHCLEYCQKSHVRRLAIVPLFHVDGATGNSGRSEAIGALVGEQFGESESNIDLAFRMQNVARHAAIALFNAVEHQSLPLFSVVQGLRRANRFSQSLNRPKLVWGLILLGAVIAGLTLVPADLDISGRGTLQPRTRRDVFARTDGVISEVRTEHGRRCVQGDILAMLAKPQLELEFTRVLGEMQTARKRLEGIQTARLENAQESVIAREKYNQLTAEEEEVKEQIQSLQRQHELLLDQRKELAVRSPLTGQVLTWNVRQVLESRPVHRGQILMTVADVDGPWVLEVQIPDDEMGHIFDAQQSLRPDLTTSFLLSTEAGAPFRGVVEKTAMTVESDHEGRHVLVTVRVDRDQIPRLRPGATVVAKIHCGRRALGYVWFHGLWNAIRMRVLF